MKQTHMDLPLRKCLLLFWPIHHKWPLSSLPQCIPEHSVVKFIQFLKNKKRTEDPAIGLSVRNQIAPDTKTCSENAVAAVRVLL